jgi:hypothetical protein
MVILGKFSLYFDVFYIIVYKFCKFGQIFRNFKGNTNIYIYIINSIGPYLAMRPRCLAWQYAMAAQPEQPCGLAWRAQPVAITVLRPHAAARPPPAV